MWSVNEWFSLVSGREEGLRHQALKNSCTPGAEPVSSTGSNAGLITAAVAGFREPDSCYQEMDAKRTEEMESCEIIVPVCLCTVFSLLTTQSILKMLSNYSL